MANSTDEKERTRSEAAAWVARLDGDPTTADREEFLSWVKRNPAHQRAYDKAHASYRRSGIVRQSPLSREVSLESEFPKRSSRPARMVLAASIAGLLLIGGYQLGKGIWFAPPLQAIMLTSGAEPKELTLEDGTAVRLGPSSAIRIELMKAERRAELQRGEARLSVAAERRPFILKAGERRAEVNEGQYLLRLDDGLGAIEPVGAVSSASSISTGNPAEPTTVDALDFEGAPLAEVVAEANQLNAPAVLQIDPSIAGRKVTGLYRVGDSMALARSLAAALDLDLVIVGPRTVLLEPRKK